MRQIFSARFKISILILGLIVLTACSKTPAISDASTSKATISNPASNSAIPSEVEATEYLGTVLTPISEQGSNALTGTQHIDKASYVLTINGLVDNPLTLTYEDLLGFSQQSKLMPLNCVEGWRYTAKWTGPLLKDLFAAAKVRPGALIAIFYTKDVPVGYSSLDLSYISSRNIIIGMKLNDITLPDDRGFPFQVVAESKYGYKWSKWITRIEISDNADFRGYWESAGYNNNADDNGPAFATSQ